MLFGLSVIFISHAVFASKLQPPSEEEKWFSDAHMFTGFRDTMTLDFAGGEASQYVTFSLAIGISGAVGVFNTRCTPHTTPLFSVLYSRSTTSVSSSVLASSLRSFSLAIISLPQVHTTILTCV
jgi:hypothetical protein